MLAFAPSKFTVKAHKIEMIIAQSRKQWLSLLLESQSIKNFFFVRHFEYVPTFA
jgi:hypothetical protein